MFNFSLVQSSIKFVALINIFVLFGCGHGPDNPAILNPRNPNGSGPAAVVLSSDGGTIKADDMGSAGNYVILAKTGVSNIPTSAITGNLGVSPVAASYITGFSLSAHASNVYLTSTTVTGKIYAANYASPTPSNLTTAIGSMETAYTNAAGRLPPDFSEFATGNLGGKTLAPGLYKWTNTVTIPTDVTISGGADDIWIFQIAGNVTMSAATNIILAGGAQAKNIFWQVAGQVTIGTTSHFQGIVLCKTGVTLQTNATLNGRIYAQTAVVLDKNTITEQ